MKGVMMIVLLVGLFQVEALAKKTISITCENMGYLISWVNIPKIGIPQIGIRFSNLIPKVIYYGVKCKPIIRNFKKGNFFLGLEVDYLSFKGEVSQGKGWLGYISVGGHFFLTENIILSLEIGPAGVYLKDRASGISITNSDPAIVNAGIGITF